MQMTKKVILFLVEGPTDEEALAVIFTKLVNNHDIEFDVLHTDITADEGMTVKYIEDRIEAEINKYLLKNPFIEPDDILKVIQIIDTDGAFISPSLVKQSENGKTEYFDTHINAKDKDRLIRRNISKRTIVCTLYKRENVAGFPYEIYYFSRNMEHVLHNKAGDLNDKEKEDLAFEIADQYSEQPEKFLEYLYDDGFHVCGTYKDTWEFIMKGSNSLNRYCNVAVFFERLGIGLKKENIQ